MLEREEDREELNELDAVDEASPKSVVRERLRRRRWSRSSCSASPNEPVLPLLPLRKARRRSPPLLVTTEPAGAEGVASFIEFSLSVHIMDGGFLLRRRDGLEKPKIVEDVGVAEETPEARSARPLAIPSSPSGLRAITMSMSWQTASMASSTGLWSRATWGE